MKTIHHKKLVDENCVSCSGKTPPLDRPGVALLLKELPHGWQITAEGRLEKEFRFDDFKNALCFVNCVGTVAESQHHHPDIYLKWGRVKVMLWTHKIHGLSENDFILAAKIEKVRAAY
jgi:4a-hydroxytetrahydrobiopterin dehydratase